MTSNINVEKIIRSRRDVVPKIAMPRGTRKRAAEGGCGVIGVACSEQIVARHMLQALDQMRNRGNGKGGGIAAVGLSAAQFGVSQEVLAKDYLMAIAYLEESCRKEVENQYIFPTFDVDHVHVASHLSDFSELDGLEVRPPEVIHYFVRVKPAVTDDFIKTHGFTMRLRSVEDEIVYQNSTRLNTNFYASKGEKRAFVLSHGKNILVMKMVGYGDDVIRYYQLEEMKAHIWIGHHRYPTKGRVWHPGGAHPFVGLNEALVHNGDFANYASITEYLGQRNIYPLFLTDTEVSVQVFDLLHRTYGYPLEYVIESLAPTTERDFTLLSPEKQSIYHSLQVTHMHSSPDGPWFFLIAQSDEVEDSPVYRLTGITDTSMLRPQVFAWQSAGADGPSIGLAASEKQAIDAAMSSLAAEDPRFWSRADLYWNARGGSHTDGGAFIFSAYPNGDGSGKLVCTDKFGQKVKVARARNVFRPNGIIPRVVTLPDLLPNQLYDWVLRHIVNWSDADMLGFLKALADLADEEIGWGTALETLTLLIDRRYPSPFRRSSLLSLFDRAIDGLAQRLSCCATEKYVKINRGGNWQTPFRGDQTAVIDARGYDPEGKHGLAASVVRLYDAGCRLFIITHARGHRFIGNGLGPGTDGVRIDVYGSSGDYLASGIDGAEIHVHGSAQDQLAQIMKRGKLVVHGDVGQTFMYGAKGGEVYVLGNAAGRPLINTVGRPRVVINGTCLDYLAESFMAGDPHNGGGFVILNGLSLDDFGNIQEMETPYPGGNLMSLASGGAIYVRDPHNRVCDDQLNGGEFQTFKLRDWELIKPVLEENARLFGLEIDALLAVDGQPCSPTSVYRKIRPSAIKSLQAEEAWTRGGTASIG